eukprot:2450249-Amphidinium_carterae.1
MHARYGGAEAAAALTPLQSQPGRSRPSTGRRCQHDLALMVFGRCPRLHPDWAVRQRLLALWQTYVKQAHEERLAQLRRDVQSTVRLTHGGIPFLKQLAAAVIELGITMPDFATVVIRRQALDLRTIDTAYFRHELRDAAR